MPELPEIIVIRNDLINVLPGKKILSVKTFNDYPLNPSKSHFDKYVLNTTIVEVLNIAKLIVLKLSSGYYLCSHLKMTGNILFNTKDEYVKISLFLNGGDELHYSTIRKLGYFEVWDQKKLDSYTQKIGKTALEANLEASEFISLISKKKTVIRNALLDQSLISGIGNIYANDALFLSKIHPRTKANTLTQGQLKILFKNLQFVLNEGVKNRGSSMNRYKDIFGIQGSHQEHFWVYGKKGNVCTHCKVGKIEFEKVNGRGTYYCPQCQILPQTA